MIEATYVDHMGTDLSVVNAARVSFGKKSEALGTSGVEGQPMTPILNDPDKKLINYLARHKHTSPFGHCFASFHVAAPIFVARQLVKHKFLRWNEISRRYVSDTPTFYRPALWREKSEDKKQGSGEGGKSQYFPDLYASETEEAALSYYFKMLGQGVCEEQARMILPQSTMTEWYWSGSLDALADMCKLRTKDDTQYETRKVAYAISDKMNNLFPISWKALVL